MSVRFHSPRSLFHRTHAPSSSQPNQLSQSKPLPMPPGAQPKNAPAPNLNKPLPALPPSASPQASAPASAPTVAKKPTPGTPGGALLVPVNNNNGMLASSGNAVNLPGPAPFQPATGAKPNTLVDAQGPKVEKNLPGATLTAQAGSANLKTVKHNAEGSHQLYVQGEANGPNASFVANAQHDGRLGTSSVQFVADANALKVQGQAGYSLDTRNHVYTANAFLKAETSVGVAGQVSHDFNEHVGAYATGSARASALAVAEGSAAFDPKNRTLLVAGRVGTGASAEANATFGGHLGRMHGSVTLGAVAGAVATAGGRAGFDKGKFTLATDVKAAMGVGTRVRTEVALDTSHHPKRSIKQGLVNSGLMGLSPALPAASTGPMTGPSKSALGALLKSSQMATAPGLPQVSHPT
ncbi:hypothetical protein D187_000061 [Cystobacter fuscus DSM 2262]|uniref:Uncharacterized protein n=1 Tax=Cystobacter fuscus (strain ATCC 25194 / DSM 2262 / NBRC 100088 / M29) TaxID=1242864 RepID=S9QTN6_CYSF2|nr:hypothetical protein [Cystobacter fuscus]EPX64639.1 hypothetical protein D187_000061 [Cystobacter fuscus DSM 2262]